MQLANYLFFPTRCEAALDFYTECGLGRVTSLMRHGDHGMTLVSESMRGKVMHARFEGPGLLFFASVQIPGSSRHPFRNDAATRSGIMPPVIPI
jgi:uncharacterized glyoxalase superfamily protein PhnB